VASVVVASVVVVVASVVVVVVVVSVVVVASSYTHNRQTVISCPWRDSKAQRQHGSGNRPTP